MTSARPRTLESRASRRARVLALVIALLAIVGALAPTAPAVAAARVTVTANGGAAAHGDPDYATPVIVTGSGFQSIKSGFGGIYVLFGWVRGGADGPWRPSAGGVVGDDYRYVPDSETKDNQGYERFVSFPGSDTESAAQAIMAADGSWTVDLVLPKAVFESKDRDGKVIQVDCAKVTCGVITIGAHGVKNARNESFTPVSYSATAVASADVGTEVAPAAPVEARVGLASSTVGAGDALAFTGKGFTPGEQVVAVLDSGAAAVGPIVAGVAGDVAGVLSVPRDLRAGTHELTLSGASSDTEVAAEITVTGSAAEPTPVVEAQPMWPYLVLGVALLLALIMLLTAIVTTVVRRRRSRADARAAAAAS